MIVSRAGAQWQGTLKDGKGVMAPRHGPEVPFSLGSRFEGQPASNPEELIGAALAGCYSMALTLGLEMAGYVPVSVKTDAKVRMEKDGGGFTITGIDLECTATVPGADPDRFQAVAEEIKRGCPVSRALAAVPISLKATLA